MINITIPHSINYETYDLELIFSQIRDEGVYQENNLSYLFCFVIYILLRFVEYYITKIYNQYYKNTHKIVLNNQEIIENSKKEQGDIGKLGTETNNVIFLCKYHKKYEPLYSIEETRCMALVKNENRRCRQFA